MGKIIASGVKDTAEIKNRSCQIIRFDFKHIAAAVNTAFTTTVAPLDLTKLSCKVVLHQFGQKVVLHSGDLYPPVMASMFGTPSYFQFKSGTSTAQKYAITLAKDTSVKEEIIQKAILDLGGVYNLSGQDKITVELNYRSSSLTAQVGSSTVEIDVESSIGVQSKISKWHVIQVETGVTKVDEYLKGAINSMHILNTDKDSILEADAPIETLRLTSDKLPLNKEWAQMLGDRLEMEQTKGIVDDSDQDFEIFKVGIPLRSVRLELDTVPSNINVGENYIVYRTEYTNKNLMSSAIAKSNKHALQNSRYIG